MVFFAFKTLLSPSGTGQKNIIFNFEHYDLTER
jgi:hypothetical protein